MKYDSVQCRMLQHNEYDKAPECRMAQYIEDGTVQCCMSHHNAVWRCTIENGTAGCSAVRHSTIQNGTAQCSISQYMNALWHRTMQYGIVQY